MARKVLFVLMLVMGLGLTYGLGRSAWLRRNGTPEPAARIEPEPAASSMIWGSVLIAVRCLRMSRHRWGQSVRYGRAQVPYLRQQSQLDHRDVSRA